MLWIRLAWRSFSSDGSHFGVPDAKQGSIDVVCVMYVQSSGHSCMLNCCFQIIFLQSIAKVLEADDEMHKLQRSISSGISNSDQEMQVFVKTWDEYVHLLFLPCTMAMGVMIVNLSSRTP